MSSHLYSTMTDAATSPHHASAGSHGVMEDSSDSESSPHTSTINRLKHDVQNGKRIVAKLKNENHQLESELVQMQEKNSHLHNNVEDKEKALNKATSKIKELEGLCAKREEEIDELKASLEAASNRECKLNSRLQLCEQECTQLNVEKSQLEKENAQLEEVKRRGGRIEIDLKEMLTELENLRTDNLDLKRQLVAAREGDHRRLAGIADEEESPDRMIFDQFDQRIDGENLFQELINVSGSLSTPSQRCQSPSGEDLVEMNIAAVMNSTTHSTTQTDEIPVTDSSTQFEVLQGQRRSAAVQTCGILANQRELFLRSSVHTDRMNGTAPALQPYYIPYTWYPTPNLFQVSQPAYVDRNTAERSSNINFITWIVVTAVLFLGIAIFYHILSNEGRINVTPLVDLFSKGIKFHYKRGIPPH